MSGSNTDWRLAAQSITGNDTPAGVQYDVLRSVLKLPLAGLRFGSNGQYYYQGIGGYYWSTSPNGARSRDAYFSSTIGSSNIDDPNLRGHGFSVRCLKN